MLKTHKIAGRGSKLSVRQASLRLGYFSQKLSMPEGIRIISAEFKSKK